MSRDKEHGMFSGSLDSFEAQARTFSLLVQATLDTPQTKESQELQLKTLLLRAIKAARINGYMECLREGTWQCK